MTTLAAPDLVAYLPSGFEGRILRRPGVHGAVGRTVAQFSTFPLPTDAGDFGAAVTPSMGPDDLFVVLFEYGPESLGKALFARQGMPRHLSADAFSTRVLRRGVPGQAGTQWFFTENGRPFMLFAVIGAYSRRLKLTPRLNLLLDQITVLAPS